MKRFDVDNYMEENIQNPYSVKITYCNLRKREDASFNSNVVGHITDMGVYTIVEEFEDWGKLEDGSWINLQFAERV